MIAPISQIPQILIGRYAIQSTGIGTTVAFTFLSRLVDLSAIAVAHGNEWLHRPTLSSVSIVSGRPLIIVGKLG